MRDKPVTRIMTGPPVCVEPATAINRVRQLMAKHGVHHLPVVAAGHLVGILSTADLRHATAAATAADVMQPDPIPLAATATINDAASILSAGMFHSLPVVDASGTVVGIVTSTDLIKVLLQQLPANEQNVAAAHDVPAGAAERFADADVLEAAVHAAEKQHQQGEDPGHLAAAVLYLNARTRLLDAVLKAADLYLHSGQGEREHGSLVRAVTRAKEGLRPGLNIGRA